MNRLANKVAVITGISSGIGKAAARLFCEQNAIVFGIDRDADAGEALAAELSAQKYQFAFHAADLSIASHCTEAIETCWRTYGKIDILYNNAGISAVLPFAQTDQVTLEKIR